MHDDTGLGLWSDVAMSPGSPGRPLLEEARTGAPLEPRRGGAACRHLDFGPAIPIWGFCLQHRQRINPCCLWYCGTGANTLPSPLLCFTSRQPEFSFI